MRPERRKYSFDYLRITVFVPVIVSVIALSAENIHAINGWNLGCVDLNEISVKIDPIGRFDQVATSHHTFASSSLLTPTTSNSDLSDSTCSVCSVREDKSAYWVPSLFHKAGELTVPIPEGLKLVASDPGSPLLNHFVQHNLNINGRDPYLGFPEKYSNAQNVTAFIRFPNCVRKGFDRNARDHSQFTKYAEENQACGLEYDRIPSINIHPTWNLKGQSWNSADECPFVFATNLSNVPYHANFMNGWNQAKLKELIDTCTNVDFNKCSDMIINNQISERSECRDKVRQKVRDKIQNENWAGKYSALDLSSPGNDQGDAKTSRRLPDTENSTNSAGKESPPANAEKDQRQDGNIKAPENRPSNKPPGTDVGDDLPVVETPAISLPTVPVVVETTPTQSFSGASFVAKSEPDSEGSNNDNNNNNNENNNDSNAPFVPLRVNELGDIYSSDASDITAQFLPAILMMLCILFLISP